MKAQANKETSNDRESESVIHKCHFENSSNEPRCINLVISGKGSLVPLSEMLPWAENLGVEVITSSSHCSSQGEWQVNLLLRPQVIALLTSKPMQAQFIETLQAIACGSVDNDGFNRLITLCGLELDVCVLLRAIAHYLLQIKLPFSLAYMESTLCRHPQIASAITEFFTLKFNPDQSIPEEKLERERETLDTQIDAVESIDDDRILRAYTQVVDAMVRTNFFLKEVWADHWRCLSFKLLPSKIPGIPQPVPAFEVFVFGPEVEGVHLRGGKVARGGLRWSERMEDYRTEILGLVKAQMVKNAVIVPTGAKGGFVCRTLVTNSRPDQRQLQVLKAYTSYIQALLDLTDNRVDDQVVSPARVVRYDDDDTYLVVAADKGTATFSDTANQIACEAGFWLGDAFASGGSHGYDHKKMGITARGAWESTRRLFLELGIDTQKTPFTVVGVGDMSGDVFGNGMLLSRHIRLQGAFNHQNIFIDPDPDTETSFVERQRLFDLPQSSWTDYDTKLISAGGGVFSRSAKRISVTPQMREFLGLASNVNRLAPDALIKAMLQASTDLFWNGGIGTYVRASSERDTEVGDRANDAVRITAAELGARVVVEGGNLGLTQRARIEFAMSGRLISTDAIDNSGGVDCSDHEVNIKILLDKLIKAGRIDAGKRDQILIGMTDEVSQSVLRNNFLQCNMLSQSNRSAPQFISKHAHLIQLLEREGRLNRQLEQLPDEVEIQERINNQQGLTRPEISVLLAYAKSSLYEKLIHTDVIDDPCIAQELIRYFPARLQNEYRDDIEAHPLRKEILAAQLTNQVMNRMGSTFCIQLLEDSQTDCARWIRSYTVAREALGVAEVVLDLQALTGVVANETLMDLRLQVHHPMERATIWLMENADWSLDTQTLINTYRQAVDQTKEYLSEFYRKQRSDDKTQQSRELARPDTAEAVTAKVADLEYLYYGLEIAQIASDSGRDLKSSVATFMALNHHLDLFWLRRKIDRLPAFDKWYRKARQALVTDLDASLCRISVELLYSLPDVSNSDDIIAYMEQSESLKVCRGRVNEIRSQNGRHLAMMVFLVSMISKIHPQ